VLAGFAVLALLVAGLTGALLAGGDDPSSTSTRAAATLPAATGGSTQATRVGSIYASVAAGVVQIRTSKASGTGFVIQDDGTVVTNAHVVEGETSAKVIFNDSDKAVPARILGRDESSDLAVLKVEPSAAPQLRPLALADSDAVKVGDNAIAIGYPLGLDRTVTAGIVSGLGREIKAPNGFSIDKVIQTDAPINPGNSGGPLLDTKGRVIGVNSQIATDGAGEGNVGIGFAIPSNTVREIVPQLEAGKTVAHPFLGVSTSVSASGRPGALVRKITPDSPAAKAGLHAGTTATGTDGDLIVSVDGKPVASPDDVISIVSQKKPGDKTTVAVVRNGSRVSIDVTLGTRPGTTP
jgi:putative serine protease PepD